MRLIIQPARPSPASGVDFASRNVLADPDLREGIKKFTQWPTIPQVPTLSYP
jgi:glutaredoxin-related protein